MDSENSNQLTGALDTVQTGRISDQNSIIVNDPTNYLSLLESSPNLDAFDDSQLPFTDLPNKILLNYKLINFIGEGAFGQVFLVKHISSDKQYAMKVQDKTMID